MTPPQTRRLACRIAGVALLLSALWAIVALGPGWERAAPMAGLIDGQAADLLGLASALMLYAFLIALPFAPGVEIGLLLLALFGPGMAIPVYAATVCGLTLSYLLGRLAPDRAVAGLLRRFGLDGPQPAASDQWDALARRAGRPWLRAALSHRALALAVLINTPGNSLIGGGGGLAMVAGAGRILSFPAFLLSVAAAVAPVPLAVLIFGRLPDIGSFW